MKADITLTRKQAETLLAGIANLFEAYDIPKGEAKRLATVAIKLDVAFDLGTSDICGHLSREAC